MKPLRIGIVAGEASGDNAAASIVSEIKKRFPDAIVEGIAGPKMQAAGCHSLFSMDALTVMGFSEILFQLPKLFFLRKKVIKHFLANPPDVFIGVDYPSFNLSVEKQLKAHHIKTIHFISPKLWASRENRIHNIKQSVDVMLTVFPFENALYEKHGVPVKYVGHPAASEIPMQCDPFSAREALALPQDKPIIAILPGSRSSEIRHLLRDFLKTAMILSQQKPEMLFLIPAVNAAKKAEIDAIIVQENVPLSLKIIEGHSREVMIASNAILLSHGTATLEALLIKRPMVAAYRFSWFSYWLAKYMVNISRFALPNILANQDIVPEFIQSAIDPEKMAALLLDYIEHPEKQIEQNRMYEKIHRELMQNTAELVVDEVLRKIQA